MSGKGEELLPKIRMMQLQLKRQLIMIPILLIPGIVAIVVVSKWLPSIAHKAAANPLIEISEHMQAVDGKAREIASQQIKLKTRLTVLPIKSLRDWQDPRIKVIRFLIDQEQEQQTFMLHTLRGLRDFGELMKGIDEWSYFKYTQVRRLIERSRERQQRLRDLLEEITQEQNAERELIDKPQ